MRYLIAVGVLALSAAFPGSGRAAVISSSTSFSLAKSYQGPVAGDFGEVLSDSVFSTSLRGFSGNGTLQSVDVTLNSVYTLYLDNVGAIDESAEEIGLPPFNYYHNTTFINSTIRADLDVSLLGFGGVFPSVQSGTLGLNAFCLDNYVASLTPDSVSCEVSNQVSGDLSGSFSSIGSVPLSAFIGNFPIGLHAKMGGVLDAECSDSVPGDLGDLCHIGDGGIVWSGDVTIAYTYLPATLVPEPSVLILLGTGLFGVGPMRRA